MVCADMQQLADLTQFWIIDGEKGHGARVWVGGGGGGGGGGEGSNIMQQLFPPFACALTYLHGR